jgi:nicotinate-nucleotide adenylyltransferase
MTDTALFGGTFDPVHNGHIEIARAAADRFDLAKILFIPAANPPHKPEGVTSPYEDRFRMVELACAADPRFEASRIEAGSARSYSIHTIEKLNAAGLNAPGLNATGLNATGLNATVLNATVLTRIGFLIGADAFADIRSWYRWQDVVASVEFIVVTRPGADWETPPGAIVHELTGLDLPISSSGIREQLMAGESAVAVPASVERYIHAHGLYRSQTT